VKVNDNDELKNDFVAEIIPGEVSVYVCGGHCNISLEYCIAPQDANVDDSSVDGAAGDEQYDQVQWLIPHIVSASPLSLMLFPSGHSTISQVIFKRPCLCSKLKYIEPTK